MDLAAGLILFEEVDGIVDSSGQAHRCSATGFVCGDELPWPNSEKVGRR
jgi:hypothetical protein